ncbi:MAG: glycosyltransferase [Hyphomonadaceae bacterium]
MISVVIPTLDSAAVLPRALAPLVEGAAHGLIKQVIVADGGSHDETLAIADAAGCDVVAAPRGRAKQMRAGAAAAKGKWLMFLNADAVLAPGWLPEVERFVGAAASRKRAGVFQLAFDDPSPRLRRAAFWARLRARVMKLPYADQGVLLSRFFYDGIGGYPDMAVLDDVEMARRIGARRLTFLAAQIVANGENFRTAAAGRNGWRNLTLMARYMMGADPAELAKGYE